MTIMSRSKGPAAAGAKDVGTREAVLRLDRGYGVMKWEAGVHRVQRVAETDSAGRVHTSTAAVVVMPLRPEADEPLFNLSDVTVEVMRARGPGGQHVNKTESAIRLTHNPTGISVSMQDSRSQQQNREWAWDILRARLGERKQAETAEKERAARQLQVQGSDRSDKIRTYNYAQVSAASQIVTHGQSRVTDHRIAYTGALETVLDGELHAVHDGLIERAQAQAIHDILEKD